MQATPTSPQVLPSEPEDVDINVDSEGELEESVEVEAEGPSTPETEDVIDWLLTPPVDPLVPKDAQILPLDFAFTVFGGSVYTVSFNIPAGMTPVALKGELQSTDDSELRVSTQARRVGAVSTLTTEFSFALEPEDVDSGQLVLTFTLPPGTWCLPDNANNALGLSAVIQDLRVALVGTAQPPETIADFFSADVLETDVHVSMADKTVLAEAALDAVAAATLATKGKPVDLIVEGLWVDPIRPESLETFEAPAFSKRRVQLVAGSGEAETVLSMGADGVPTLTMTGAPEELSAAVLAFTNPAIILANTVELIGLGTVEDESVGTTPKTLTFQQLGPQTISLAGYGRHDNFIGIPKGAFGRGATAASIHVEGVYSMTDNSVGTLQFLWQDTLVHSIQLNPEDAKFEADFALPDGSPWSGGYLTLRLQAVTADGQCIDESRLPPIRVDVSTLNSFVEVSGDASRVPSFQAFPQTFGDEMAVAFAQEITPGELSATGALVSTLQRATPRLLNVVQTTARELVDSSKPGIIVGADPALTKELGAPLYASDPILVMRDFREVSIPLNSPYATLQAVRHDGRPLLLLGGHRGKQKEQVDEALITVVSDLPGTSWWNLDGDVRIATEGNPPLLLDGDPLPEPSGLPMVLVWIAGGSVLVVLGAIAAGVFATRRRQRVENAQKQDAEHDPLSELDLH